jgi:hypothetical protein
MLEKNQCRQKFISLVEAIFLELGFELPTVAYDPEVCLAMEMERDGIAFEIVHAMDETVENFMVECKFGAIPVDRTTDVLKRLMEVNLTLLREHRVAYGVDPVTNHVTSGTVYALVDVDPIALLDDMSAMARQAKIWQQTHFLEETSSASQAQAELPQFLLMP